MPFAVKDVETDLDAYHDLIARGFRAVPVTFVGDAPGVAIKGFNEADLRAAIGI